MYKDIFYKTNAASTLKYIFLTLLFFTITPYYSTAQTSGNVSLSWENKNFDSLGTFPVLANASSQYFAGTFQFTYSNCIELTETNVSLEIIKTEYVPSATNINLVPVEWQNSILKQKVTFERELPFLCYSLFPYKIENGKTFLLKSFSYKLVSTATEVTYKTNNNNLRRASINSVLSAGKWFKVKVTEDGFYKLDYNYLKSKGINPDDLDPRTFKIYGNHGGMLPMGTDEYRPADLQENAIKIAGEDDGKFDGGDYVLFYAEGPHKWLYDSASKKFNHQVHLYDNASYYYITYGGANGKRISKKANISDPADATYSYFDDHRWHENEANYIKERNVKGGRQWFGERLDYQNTYSFNESFQDAVVGKKIWFKTNVLVGSVGMINPLDIDINGQSLTVYAPPVYDDYLAPPVTEAYTSDSLTANPSGINITYTFTKLKSSSFAFIDNYELHAQRYLKMNQSQLPFATIASTSKNTSRFQLDAQGKTVSIFNITDPFNLQELETTDAGNTKEFTIKNNKRLLRFMATDGSSYRIPEWQGSIANQDLHGEAVVDYIIITHPDFLKSANKLALHHTTKNNLKVLVVTPSKIYEEYSSGTQDVTAIRDFLMDMYQKNTGAGGLKYVLMLGAASFDYKSRLPINTNFVPTFESIESISPLGNYPSDDYYAALDPSDQNWENDPPAKLEIGVGRLPVGNETEAEAMVNKSINYQSAAAMGEWRNNVAFIADDMNLDWEKDFFNQSEEFSKYLDTNFCSYNIDKIYMDAFKQQAIGGGERYPDVVTSINNRFAKGGLIINYIGHGGEYALAHENVITIPQINKWENPNNYPVFFTATCEFSRYDDPNLVSAGEQILLNQTGGSIAMFSTTRTVYSGANREINNEFWTDAAFPKINSGNLTMGNVYKTIKNRPFAGDNDRRFCLLGDPALEIAFPKNRVITDSINGIAVDQFTDTIKAFDKVTIKAHVADKNGVLISDFTGRAYPTLFDKAYYRNTLQNDAAAQKYLFKNQDNVIYKGTSSVTNGKFQYSFIVPKDISYKPGYTKISYYAENGKTDAQGCDTRLLVGGSNPVGCNDTEGPLSKLYLNDYTFKSGSITGTNAVFIAAITDDGGINTTGNGIGHDLLLTLDKGTKTQKDIVVNGFYTAKINSYTEGEVRYPLTDLTPGTHTLHFKVWDVCNNSSETSINFEVADPNEVVLENVKNYPNPFNDKTTFAFDHNRAGENISITIDIYDVVGKKVHSIRKEIQNASSHIDDISWNAQGIVSSGMLIYRLKVNSDNAESKPFSGKMILTQ